MNKFFLAAIILLSFSCNTNKNPRIQISTNFGNIEAELYPGKAPKTVAAFLSYIDSGWYEKSSFYRVLLEESMSGKSKGLIQGGIWQSNNKKAESVTGIEHESPKQTGLSHTTGTLSLARTTVGTASTEFFICIGDQTDYDTGNPDGLGFAAFGKITSGMEIVRKIQERAASGQSFVKPVEILKIEKL